MSKVAQIRADSGENIRESMASRRPSPVRGVTDDTEEDPRARAERAKDGAMIPLESLVTDTNQPRKEFDPEGLERLAASLKDHGQLMPIRVRWDSSLKYFVVVAGERRLRAARLAGLAKLHCVIADPETSPEAVFMQQLIENCVREDLKPIEQARAFARLIAANNWTYREVADRIHMSHVAVHRALVLLDLPEGVQEQVERGALPATTAAEIAHLETPAEQSALAERAVREKLPRSEVTRHVREKTGKSTAWRAEHDGFKVTGPPGATNERAAAALRVMAERAAGRPST